MSRKDLAARLRATFLIELEEQVRRMNADLLALERDPAASEHLKSLFRSAHTLKGAARAADVPLVEEVCHALEALLARARDAGLALGADEFTVLFPAADALEDAGRRLRAEAPLEGSPLASIARSLRGTGDGPPPDAALARAAPAARPEFEASPRHVDTEAPAPVVAPAPAPAGSSPAAAAAAAELRVEAGKLDALVAATGRLLTLRSRLAGRPAELEELVELAQRSALAWHRARDDGRRGGRTEALERLGATLERLAEQTARLLSAAGEEARAMTRLSDELGHQVMDLRMRPFSDAVEALPRLVRDLGRSAGKDVRLVVTGEDVQADREIWGVVAESLLHLVRNSVDHGIEPTDAREAAGKPATGTITVAAAARGDRVLVTVSDDGAGLDLESIRAEIEGRGDPVPESEEEMMEVLFRGGISTRGEASLISGRGVGLDSVRAAMARVRGTIRAESQPGAGTTFSLESPLTLTSARTVLVRVGSQVLCLPTTYVERIVRVAREEVRRVGDREVVSMPGGAVPVVSLARLLGPPLTADRLDGPIPAIQLRASERRLLVAVDEILSEEELLVRQVKRLDPAPPYLAGAAILSSGRAALVLNSVSLLDAGLRAAPAHDSIVGRPREAGVRRRAVLVADDSITTRMLEQSILQAAGYEVAVAADGAEAWRMLQQRDFDLVVSDVEMPRMDGLALCEAIRASRRLQSLPVVLVTGLETPAQRARGLEVGADAYLPKSSFDQEELLETVRQLVG